jgi:hypothetical protein
MHAADWIEARSIGLAAEPDVTSRAWQTRNWHACQNRTVHLSKRKKAKLAALLDEPGPYNAPLRFSEGESASIADRQILDERERASRVTGGAKAPTPPHVASIGSAPTIAPSAPSARHEPNVALPARAPQRTFTRSPQ